MASINIQQQMFTDIKTKFVVYFLETLGSL